MTNSDPRKRRPLLLSCNRVVASLGSRERRITRPPQDRVAFDLGIRSRSNAQAARQFAGREIVLHSALVRNEGRGYECDVVRRSYWSGMRNKLVAEKGRKKIGTYMRVVTVDTAAYEWCCSCGSFSFAERRCDR